MKHITEIDYSDSENILSIAWDGELPVNPIQIATDMGIVVKYSDTLDCICKSYTQKGINIIEYNTDNHLRKRFCVAHALAHFCLQHVSNSTECIDNVGNYDIFGGVELVDYEANLLATELLVPKMVLDFLIETKGIHSLSQLADIFDVSKACMEYRLKLGGWIN